MSPPPRTNSQRSVLVMLLALFFFTANVLLLRGLSLPVPGADGWAGILFRGAVGFGILLTVFGGRRGLHLRGVFTHPKLAARGIVGAIATLLFYITYAFRHLSVAKGSSIQMLLPLFTAVGAFALFSERLSLLEILGGLLTLFATWQVLRSPGPLPRPAPSAPVPVPNLR